MVRSGKKRSTNGRGRDLGVTTVLINAVFAGVGGLYALTHSTAVTLAALVAVVVLVGLTLLLTHRVPARKSPAAMHGSAPAAVLLSSGQRKPRRPAEGPLEAEARPGGLPDWFDDFYRTNFRALVYTARFALWTRGLDESEAEDIVQEVLTRKIKNGSWSDIEKPLPYFRRAVVLRVISEAESGSRKAQPSDAIHDLPGDRPPGQDAWMDEEWIRDLLSTLTPAEREVMSLVLDGFRGPDIAALLGAKETTVRSTTRNARNKLKAQVPPQSHRTAIADPVDAKEERP
ncbi:DNA-directed RNA polymerase specialized sigma24 family protein [Actinoplanes octamycinicus]|uniref:DNA-directed RNA polymerase specialized sigma24 family protein n=1 Tax=Actinoplanes octamycinicus TaxID=135948 RepID=A0A7W7M950_9ACTN|nr:sigma-70 family RNA polymerase sigma factor [Actinoplanes octamycinicus]MBB4741619.1 DNA-directed RNA polymerase specialized sigma24 family protein [Actinoplanes octamycinicus]GIE57171.1 hypothetical protein Aoc01nite_25730 [Actinoplanes octamycinicus]